MKEKAGFAKRLVADNTLFSSFLPFFPQLSFFYRSPPSFAFPLV